MPKQITVTLYEYDELSPKAQEKARDWYRTGDDFDADYEDFEEVCTRLGVTLDERQIPLMNGTTRRGVKIWWSGFSHQGDGACFEGTWRHKADAVAAITEHAPQDAELKRIAEGLAAMPHGHSATVKHSGRYYHERSTDITVYDAEGEEVQDTEDVAELLRDLMRWMYKQLEADYDWRNADEQVAENIRVNEYTFYKDGTRAREH